MEETASIDWMPYIYAAMIFAIAEIILHYQRERRQRQDQLRLCTAKQEMKELAQLPLHNPYPLIQVSQERILLFANPQAFDCFPGIGARGQEHPVLKGIGDVEIEAVGGIKMREISYNGKIYEQSIISSQAGDKKSFILYCTDITERKKYEGRLRHANKMTEQARAAEEKARMVAERANHARGDFLANMSHELRTPMNGIIGLSEMLSQAEMNAEHKELIQAVNISAKSLLILLNDILDFSKIEAGELTVEKIGFDIRKVISGVESLQAAVARKKGLEIISSVDGSVPAFVIGDPSRLQQILNNLVGNAIKFTDKGSVRISVTAKKDGEENYSLGIAVADTGIGIPHDKQEQVFQKFRQAHSSTARKYGGTGLGLSITKNLAELMGGAISLKSDVGKGSVFTVHIPVLAAQAIIQEEEADQSGIAKSMEVRSKILVVDDHPVNLLVMRTALKKMGFANFDEASSGAEALQKFAKNSYDLVFLDCQMPEMDGFEVAARIRGDETLSPEKRKATIVALTADAMKGAREKCMSLGMDDYISKPIDGERLRQVLAKWLPATETHKAEEKRADVVPLKLTRKTEIQEEVKMQAKVFDVERLHGFTDGDPEIEKQLIDIFRETLETDMMNLQKSYQAGNYQDWDTAAHKIFGSCVHVGAMALAEVCDKAQNLKEKSPQKIRVLHQIILREYKRLVRQIDIKKAA